MYTRAMHARGMHAMATPSGEPRGHRTSEDLRAHVATRAGLLATAAILHTLSACEGSSGALLVDVRTDLAPGLEFDSIRTELDGAGPQSRGAGADDDYRVGVRVAEYTDVQRGTRSVQVSLLRGGVSLMTRRVRVDFQGSRVVTVVLTRDCRGVTCPLSPGGAETECLGGRCVEPNCSDDQPDACGSAECADATDCVSGVPCVRAECITGACLFVGDSSACESGEVCLPDEGCVRPGAERDAGVDAGPMRVPATAAFQSVGGGAASSSAHRVRLSIGAPQPAGVTSNGAGAATLGPGAAGR
jgi:hypothetical protein